ncbi:hypothetical protein EDC19_1954 [Natranaerovirga hydrolytica]|uniref:HD domain-containing protein n=1 Tax=Natranaerovirga hydrolytica TaxID=680378 RepID=A0A4R1MQI8_9FIRM|nr:HD domain-containing protein [Natranaerovirga hydrolytica]TCK92799.1 hypothetical protein EDC19_1954 [Natranaerovirga hydrolytica]
MNKITYNQIREDIEIKTYLEKADKLLGVLGITEHSFVHAGKTANTTARILEHFGYEERTVELGKIAGYIHDIGNMVNRVEHAQTGAIITFNRLTRLGMDPEEIADIVAAIGNHDEDTGYPVNPISAALILADKGDVRRSRVRNTDIPSFDIHDRVNYAVTDSSIQLDVDHKIIALDLTIDSSISSKMEYFEIFLTRMLMCRRAANFLGATFQLYMNKTQLL